MNFHSESVVIAPTANSVKYSPTKVCQPAAPRDAQSPPPARFAIAAPMFTTMLSPVRMAAGMMLMAMS